MSDWSVLLSPDEVVVDRESRQRRELVDIEDLAESILRRGQIQPIVVQRGTNRLIAGERRTAAIRWLAEKHPDRVFSIKAVYSDELDLAELQAIEFEENYKRKDLTWQDNCLAVLAYHNLRKAADETWTLERTGEAMGVSATEVIRRCEVAEALHAKNPLVLDAPKFSTAVGIVQRQNERKHASEVAQIMSFAVAKPAPKADPSTPLTIEDEVLQTLEAPSSGTGFIINDDFQQWAKTYDGPRFNLIHCDFPYGVGMDKSDQGSGNAYGTYEDTPEIYWALVDTLLNYLDNFCEQSAHLLFWFSMDFYHETLQALSTKFVVNPFPLIWHKTDNSGILPDASRGPRRIYETAFLASRGDRKIVRAVSNVVGSPIQRGRHMSEKPQAVLGHFFRMLVDEHSAVLDPTAGSGSAIRAAATAGASRYLGLELNTEFAEHADEVLAAHLEELDR